VWALPDPSCVPPQPPMDAMDAKVASSQDPGTHGTHVGQVASMDADPMPLFDADNPGDPARFTR